MTINSQKIFLSEVIQALIDEQILHADKHYNYVTFEQRLFMFYAEEYVNNFKFGCKNGPFGYQQGVSKQD